jgi:Ca2+-binding RTX toxin-like protein
VFSKGGIGNDLVLTLANTMDSVTLRDVWEVTPLSAVEFADGTVWDRDTLMSKADAPSDDVLVGTDADDFINGNLGKDVYLIGPGGGHDVVYEGDGSPAWSNEADTIRFTAGITAADVTVLPGLNESLLTLSIHDGASTVDLMFWPETLPRIEFADGTIWGSEVLQAALEGSVSNFEYYQRLIGSFDDEVLVATTAAYTEFHGMAGDDTLIAGEGGGWLIGGAGNDTLIGGAAWNNYFIDPHSGHDTVIATAGSEISNVLEFGYGIAQDQLRFARHAGEDGLDLVIAIDGSDTTATINGWYDPVTPTRLDSLYFLDACSELFGAEFDAAIQADNAATGSVILSGDAIQNQTLTVVNTLADLDGMDAVGYQWQSSIDGSEWSDISGTTADSFVLTEADVGQQLRVVVSYVDREGIAGSVASAATAAIANINDAPVVVRAISDQRAVERTAFSLTLAADSFADVDAGDSLVYAATLADGAALPSWLSFDAATFSFSGTPPGEAVGSLSLTLTATDLAGASAASSFTLNVARSNQAPVLVAAIGDLSATQDRAFAYAVPAGSFADSDPGDSLNFTATLADGTALPDWLGFDVATASFSGTPGAGSPGVLALRVVATDSGGLSAAATFNLSIGQHLRGTASSDTMNFSASSFVGVAMIDGGAGNDAITGSVGNDIIVGGGGTDNLIGGDGDDTFLVSGTDVGYDRFEGGAGYDVLQGSAGDDTFRMYNFSGTATVEKVDSGGGDDIIAGTGSSDTLDFSGTELVDIVLIDGGAGNDAITGSAGNDNIAGGSGTDNLIGGDGDDTFLVSGTDAGYDRFEGGAGYDVLQGSGGDDTFRMYNFSGTATVERIDGNGGNDVIAGTGSSDTLDFSATELIGIAMIDGGAGNDAITGSAGNDVIVGGTGSDNLIGSDGDDTFLISGTDAGYDRFEGGAGFDVLQGSAGDDTFRMYNFSLAATAERIDGNGGNDVIAGTGSSDTLDFSATELIGIAMIDGGAGNDAITGSAGNDVIVGGSGTDNLIGGDGDDAFLISGTDAGYDRFEGGAGDDVLRGSAADDTFRMYNFSGTATVERIDGNGGNDVIAGTGSSDTLDFSATELAGIAMIDGGSGNDAITGSAGSDIIVGGSGTDNLSGGDGDDAFLISGTDAGYDRFEGGAGFDVLQGSTGDDTFRMYNFSLTATVEKIDGNGGNDVIAGTGSSDTLNFSATELVGIAMIDGGAGNDVIVGSAANDVIVGGTGSDNLIGSDGDDTFLISGADAGYDRFDGGAGYDVIQGSTGDDVIRMYSFRLAATVEKIDGGGGNDILAGTGSSDTLDFSATELVGIALIDGGAGNDAITGSSGNDIIVGGIGSDNLRGGDGDDTFLISGTDAGYDRFDGGAGYDVLRGSAGDDTFRMYTYNGTATVEKIDGGGGNDVIAGTGSSDTLNLADTELAGIAMIDGGAGNDAITGSSGNDLIVGGTGTDRLTGGQGNDTYRIGLGDGADTVVEDDATAGNTDMAEFLAGISADQIWLRHLGNNLEASIIGTADKLTVENWYLGEQYHVEQFRTADGKLLLDSQVENLVQAMAVFAPPAAGQTTLPPVYQDSLAPLIAANWQ